MVSISDIKSRFTFNILDELSKHQDRKGNYEKIGLNDIVKILINNKKISNNDIDVSKVRRLVTDMDNPLGLLDSGYSGDYSINGTGLGVLENWREEYGESEVDKKKLKRIQKDLYQRTKDFEKRNYDFSVFISHSYLDIEFVEKICEKMMENNIFPRFYFQEKSHKIVRNKLCDMIDRSDILMIFFSKNSLKSQMTNNEIGFVVGKSYYTEHYKGYQKDFIYKIKDKDLGLEDLRGFFTRGDEIITIENEESDIQEIIEEMRKQHKKNLQNIKKYKGFSIRELLEFVKLPNLKKMARSTPIKVSQSASGLRDELSEFELYTYEDYLHNMDKKELKNVCSHFKETRSGNNLELILKIKKHLPKD